MRLFLSGEEYEEFFGNLDEVYFNMQKTGGLARARIWFWCRVMESLPWIIVDFIQWRCVMLFNYVKLAIRTLVKDKFHSVLNCIGLSTGIAFAIIILLLAQNELSYDRHHINHERIHRFGVNMTIGGVNSTQSTCNLAVGPLLKREMPEIEAFVRFTPVGDVILKYNNKTFTESNYWAADANVFAVFSHDFLYGNPQKALQDPDTIVMTEQVSSKVFGSRNPVGEMVEIPGRGLFKVTGVIRDLPDNSHLTFNALVSLSTLLKEVDPSSLLNPRYLGSGMTITTYFLFGPGFTSELFQQKFQKFYDQKMAGKDTINYRAVVEPLTDIYLNSRIWKRFSERNRVFLWGFAGIGFFILLLASINYINLATSRFSNRAKEIGLKKVVGAGRNQLIAQFLSESMVLSFFSLVLAFLLVKLILHATPFNQLILKELQFRPFSNLILLAGSLLIALFTGFISGIYPSFYLTRISPASVLKSKFKTKPGNWSLRNTLVVFQFVITIGILAMTMLMKNQLLFVRSHDLGFDRENMMVIMVKDRSILTKMKAFKEEITAQNGIISAAFSTAVAGQGIEGWAYKWETETGTMDGHAFRHMRVDADYFDTMGIKVLKGRNFNPARVKNPERLVIVNEALVRRMNWTDPIGKKYSRGEVIGVVKDFNFFSLHQEIQPMFITLPMGTPRFLTVKIAGQQLSQTLDFIKNKWQKMIKGSPIEYSFINQELDQLYRNDTRQLNLIRLFSYVAILICCLGLLGLTSYSTERRTKEVAVRKVLGASISQIVAVLFKPILIVVVIALVIATPISLWLSFSWLKNFAFRTGISPLIFILSGMTAILIAFITASFHSLRIARKKPVETLKYE